MHILIYIMSFLLASACFVITFLYVLRGGKVIKGVILGWGLFIVCTFFVSVVLPSFVALHNDYYPRFFPEAMGISMVIFAGWLPALQASAIAWLLRHAANRFRPHFLKSPVLLFIASFRMFIYIGLCCFFLSTMLLGVLYFSTPTPPDLNGCNRLEIRYPNSALNYFFPVENMQTSLSPEEKKILQSIKVFEVTDQELITAFAQDVSLGIPYSMRDVGTDHSTIHVSCYHNDKHLISFMVSMYGLYLETQTGEKHVFKYSNRIPSLKLMEPPEISQLKLRYNMH